MEKDFEKFNRQNPEFWNVFFEELKKDCKENYYCSECKIKRICEKAKKEVKQVTGRNIKEWRSLILGTIPNQMFKNAVYEKKKREQYINV